MTSSDEKLLRRRMVEHVHLMNLFLRPWSAAGNWTRHLRCRIFNDDGSRNPFNNAGRVSRRDGRCLGQLLRRGLSQLHHLSGGRLNSNNGILLAVTRNPVHLSFKPRSLLGQLRFWSSVCEHAQWKISTLHWEEANCTDRYDEIIQNSVS